MASSNSPTRRILGDVSPNVRKITASQVQATNSLSKPVTGSPLKRSFTAALENSQGFTYLKRRKGSFASSLAPTINPLRSGSVQGNDTLSPDLAFDTQLSPTEINTPSCAEEEGSDELQGEQPHTDLQSFSSLINYDGSSQPATTAQRKSSRPLFNGPSMAELLKLRLRVAMYKVRTNQVGIPFDELEVDDEVESPKSHNGRNLFPHCINTTDESIEDLVAARKREAQSTTLTGLAPVPKLLPGPLLLPTAYSSHMIYQDPTTLPSSPPVACSPERSTSILRDHTPAKPSRLEEQDLTSSAVKGHVAEGLLGLRNAG